MKRRFRVTVDGETFTVEVEEIAESSRVEAPPAFERPAAVLPRRVERVQRARPEHAVGEGIVTAPMPGVISEVKVGAGDPVDAGTSLLVLEAMKMENEIYSPVSGVVREITEQGQDVDYGKTLVVIE